MSDADGDQIISFNGEIYNFRDLRAQLCKRHRFRTQSDTEVILHAYREWGPDCVQKLRGMFAFAIWDEPTQSLLLARDRFGIKPLYTAVVGDTLYFASEIKALLPFLPEVRIDHAGVRDYLAFQFCLQGKTLFRDVQELPPATLSVVKRGRMSRQRYWLLDYGRDYDHTEKWFVERCSELIDDSIRAHLVSDVPVGGYVSGGIDSSAAAILGSRLGDSGAFMGFHGRFDHGPNYDESEYARAVAAQEGFTLRESVITADDFVASFDKIIYHLDFPVAGPGSLPQFVVSQAAARERKVVLGGQGGDEVFGGYVRYLIAYFEQCFKGAIAGVPDPSKFIVTYESILGSLHYLRGYEPLMRHFFGQGMFEEYDRRYYRLVDRSGALGEEIHWGAFTGYSPYESFREVFFSNKVGEQCYFDSMLHFDFVTLLPALLQVEDRMSMAHGIESRTPFLDHPLVEFVAAIPANVKFKNGELKRLPKRMFATILPRCVMERQDKMGFPVPLVEWFHTTLRGHIQDRLASPSQAGAEFYDHARISQLISNEQAFSRKVWGFLCLEAFFHTFIDRHERFRDGEYPDQDTSAA